VDRFGTDLPNILPMQSMRYEASLVLAPQVELAMGARFDASKIGWSIVEAYETSIVITPRSLSITASSDQDDLP
jgi:hypothetical protein